uniref:Uncharacterized protein n=1 Tax=Anguilla anguilla TaxID=7936 RepID=A0A0E9PIM5_ANGAN
MGTHYQVSIQTLCALSFSFFFVSRPLPVLTARATVRTRLASIR